MALWARKGTNLVLYGRKGTKYPLVPFSRLWARARAISNHYSLVRHVLVTLNVLQEEIYMKPLRHKTLLRLLIKFLFEGCKIADISPKN